MTRAREQLRELAASGRLYPSVILHGGEAKERLGLASRIARALLCEREPEVRPCGKCKHCRRIDLEADKVFHPDFVFVRRDPKKRETVIPVDKVRTLLQTAQVSPFEARGQVFVIVEAETLHPAGANVLLKTLEEPADRSPRNFLLLASSANELLPTLRSRSLTVYLGAGDAAGDVDEQLVADLVDLWRQRPGDDAFALWASTLAARLLKGGGFEDIRARQCWTRIAGALAAAARTLDDRADRAAALALSADLLDAHRLRQRSIRPDRIIEGLAARRLRRDRPQTGFESSVNELLGPP
jgi:DNA polymerase-3 subunit delta'